jgi:hypothetical protein
MAAPGNAFVSFKTAARTHIAITPMGCAWSFDLVLHHCAVGE